MAVVEGRGDFGLAIDARALHFAHWVLSKTRRCTKCEKRLESAESLRRIVVGFAPSSSMSRCQKMTAAR